ncbi:MAG: hypothetical protein ABI330_18140 [Caldimonas sp.]|nr:hypothetical protein [Pseudomonadota bacterium]
MPAHVTGKGAQVIAELLGSRHAFAGNAANQLVYVGRNDSKLLRGDAERRHGSVMTRGDGRRRRALEKIRQIGSIGQSGGSSPHRQSIRRAATQSKRQLRGGVRGWVEFAIKSAC